MLDHVKKRKVPGAEDVKPGMGIRVGVFGVNERRAFKNEARGCEVKLMSKKKAWGHKRASTGV